MCLNIYDFCLFLSAFGQRFAHGGVGHDVLHAVEVHDAELALAEGLGDGLRDLGLGLDDLGLHLLDAGAHFLLGGDGHGAAAFGLGLAQLLVGLGALGFQHGADVGDFARAATPATLTSAMSIETISNAVCESSPLSSTLRLMWSGFSSTSL